MDSEVKINLNLCSTEQLHSFVPQLSFDLAHKIVSYRRRKGPFESLESLLDIRGINRKLFTNLRQRVFVADEGNTFGPNDRQCRGERNRKMRRRQTISSSRSRREFKGRLGEKLYLHPVKRKENRKQKRCQFPPNDVTRIDQEGLLIFLKGDLKEYSRVLDGIQITVSPKQKSVTGNSWSSSFTCNDQHNTSGSSNPRDQVKTPESCEPRPTEEPSNAIINKTPKETQESPLTRNGTLFDSFTSNEQTSLIEKSTRLCPSRTAGVRSLAVANKHQETQTEDYKRHEESEEDEEQEPSKNERVRSWLSETQDSPPFFSDQRVGLQTEYESAVQTQCDATLKRPRTSTPDEFRTPIGNTGNRRSGSPLMLGSNKRPFPPENRAVPRCLRHSGNRKCDCKRKRHRKHRSVTYREKSYNDENGLLQCRIL